MHYPVDDPNIAYRTLDYDCDANIESAESESENSSAACQMRTPFQKEVKYCRQIDSLEVHLEQRGGEKTGLGITKEPEIISGGNFPQGDHRKNVEQE